MRDYSISRKSYSATDTSVVEIWRIYATYTKVETLMKTFGKLPRNVGYLNASMVGGKVVKKSKVHGEDVCKEQFHIFQIFYIFKIFQKVFATLRAKVRYLRENCYNVTGNHIHLYNAIKFHIRLKCNFKTLD